MKRPVILLAAGLAGLTAGCDRESEKQEAPDIKAAEPEQAAPAPEAAPQPAEPREVEPREEVEAEDQSAEERAEQSKEANQLVKDAAATLRQMKGDAKLKGLLSKAKGVLIVPSYGRAAAGVGASGGEGALVAKANGKWTDPVLYDIGGISVGAQFGGEGGEVAMLLMSDEALNSFKQENNFSLDAGAKLTIVDYSAVAEATTLGEGKDVIFWSDTEGAFAGVSLSATNISWDEEENPAYYGKPISAKDVLNGKDTGVTKGELHKELTGL